MRQFKYIAGVVVAGVVGAGALVSAKHPTNAGPENVEIKFKVPKEPAYSPAEALKKFKIDEGFEVQLVASEPMVEDPVGMSFDEKGRMYVVEMRGYMHDIEGKGEKEPIGRVKLLEDVDGDGLMDKASVFVDGLVMPRGVMAVAGGALVAEPPYLTHYRDTDEDGVADEKKVIAEDFGRRGGQPEHMANTPIAALDNWIYSANYPRRFRYEKGKWISASGFSRGQWGITQDDIGRLYYNYNSDLLRGDMAPAHYLLRNPNFVPSAGMNSKVMNIQTVWPGRPTPGVNRGYQEGGLRDDGTLKSVTATCGPGVYRGDLFPEPYRGNVFVPDPAVNLVKRIRLDEKDGVMIGENAYEGREFLVSTDERFRPVQAMTGPDGALYVVDLYRGVLQHTAFLTNYLIKNIKDRELETPIHLGRIWRIVPKGMKARAVKLPESSEELVAMLGHGNGWVRDGAQRVLVERGETKVLPSLRRMARRCENPLGRLHSLWTLEGMGKMEQEVALAAMTDADARVRAAGVRMMEAFMAPAMLPDTLPPVVAMAKSDQDFGVRLQLALTLSNVQAKEAEEALAELLKDGAERSALMREAAVSGLRGRELEFLDRMKTGGFEEKYSDLYSMLAQAVMAERRGARVERLFTMLEGKHDRVTLAMLEGMAGGRVAARVRRNAPVRTGRMIYLEKQPAVLAELLSDPNTKPLAERVDPRVAWVGKPGTAPPPVIRPLNDGETALFEEGKTIYAATCASCHQPNGQGQDGLAPPLVDSEWVLGSHERMARIVLHGVAGPIRVNGLDFNLEMPGLATLTDEEIAAALTYVRREWEHGGEPVTAEMVKKIRQTEGERGMWSAEELGKIK